MPAESAVACVLLSVVRATQMPEPGEVSVSDARTGPTAFAAACRRLAPVPVRPLEMMTEVSVRVVGRNAVMAVAVAVLDVGGTTRAPDSTLV